MLTRDASGGQAPAPFATLTGLQTTEDSLPLQEELLRTGAWLFRWRSYVPLAALVLVLAQLPGFSYLGGGYDRVWELVCLGVGLVGLAVRAHVIGHVPHGTSGRNTH